MHGDNGYLDAYYSRKQKVKDEPKRNEEMKKVNVVLENKKMRRRQQLLQKKREIEKQKEIQRKLDERKKKLEQYKPYKLREKDKKKKKIVGLKPLYRKERDITSASDPKISKKSRKVSQNRERKNEEKEESDNLFLLAEELTKDSSMPISKVVDILKTKEDVMMKKKIRNEDKPNKTPKKEKIKRYNTNSIVLEPIKRKPRKRKKREKILTPTSIDFDPFKSRKRKQLPPISVYSEPMPRINTKILKNSEALRNNKAHTHRYKEFDEISNLSDYEEEKPKQYKKPWRMTKKRKKRFFRNRPKWKKPVTGLSSKIDKIEDSLERLDEELKVKKKNLKISNFNEKILTNQINLIRGEKKKEESDEDEEIGPPKKRNRPRLPRKRKNRERSFGNHIKTTPKKKRDEVNHQKREEELSSVSDFSHSKEMHPLKSFAAKKTIKIEESIIAPTDFSKVKFDDSLDEPSFISKLAASNSKQSKNKIHIDDSKEFKKFLGL